VASRGSSRSLRPELPSRRAGRARDAEVAIVGGGPAGAAAAIHLARLGRRVVLFERSLPGRPKLCGDFLSPDAILILARLGVLPAIERFDPPRVHEVRVTASDGSGWTAPLPAPGWGLTRERLDETLLQQAASAGTDIRRGWIVHRLRAEAGLEALLEGAGPEGPFRFEAGAALLATGKASPLTGRRASAPSFLAFQAHYEGPPISPRVEIHAFHGGYLGLIDVENGRRNLCMLVRFDATQRPNRPEAFVARAVEGNPSFASWLAQARRISEWHSTPHLDFARREPAPIGGALCIGDAAGVVAPIAGDGQAMALRSAQLVAPILFDHFQGRLDPLMARSLYRNVWREEFQGRMRTARFLQRMLLSSPAVRAAVRLLPRAPQVGRLLIEHTRGPVACAP
jgi:flavin-dependent dehydrogenase